MDFHNNAWDEATRLQLEAIARRGRDCFGESLFITPTVSYDRVLSCLAEKPMRARQIAVRTQADREAIDTALDSLVSMHQVWRDEEHFFHLCKVRIH